MPKYELPPDPEETRTKSQIAADTKAEKILWDKLQAAKVSLSLLERAECGHAPSIKKVISLLKQLKLDTPANRRFLCI